MGAHAQCSVTPYALGAALAIPVPPPMIEVEISKPLARHIQVAPVGTSGGGAARVRGVLRPQPQGGWRLEPLPKHAAGAPGAAPVAGVAEQLPEQQKVLLWGQVAVEPLLAALQAAGFYWTSVCNEPAQPLPLAGSTRGSSEHAQSLRVAEGAESASEHAQPPAAQGGIGSVSAPGQPPPAERHAGAGTEGARPVVVVRIAEADGEIRCAACSGRGGGGVACSLAPGMFARCRQVQRSGNPGRSVVFAHLPSPPLRLCFECSSTALTSNLAPSLPHPLCCAGWRMVRRMSLPTTACCATSCWSA